MNGETVNISFKFEKNPYPEETEPSFTTDSKAISGSDTNSYFVNIPVQDAENTYSSFLLYLVERDISVTITGLTVTTNEPLPLVIDFTLVDLAAFDMNITNVNNNELLVTRGTGAFSWLSLVLRNNAVFPLSSTNPNITSLIFTRILKVIQLVSKWI